MPAAIPIGAQIAASSIAGAIGLGGLSSAAIVAGAGMLGSYVASRIIGSDAGNHIDALANIKLNTSTTQRTVPLIYGEHKVGSNDVFIEVSKTGTKYIYIIHCLGEGECEGISQDKNGIDQVFINERLASKYKSGIIQYWFHSGTNTQAVDSNISSALGGKFTDPMVNTSYLLFKIKFDTKIFTGIPSRTVVMKGIKIFDYRVSTTSWSQNPALILYDYMTNTRYGLGWDTSLFDTGIGSTWESTADYCDIDEPCSGKPIYFIDYYVGSQMRSQSIIDTILSHFRGSLSWFAGKIYLTYTDLRYEATIFSIADDVIARTPSGHDIISVSQPSSFGIPDGMLVKYYNKKNNWTLDDIPVGDTKGNIQQIVFNAFSDRGLALDLGRYTLERNRLNKVISLTARADLIELDINDVGVLRSSELGLEGQLVRVKESSITSDGLMNLSLILEDYDLYDSIYNKDLTTSYVVDIPNITDPPPTVWNITFEEVSYINQDRQYIRLNIRFDEPIDYPWFDYVEVYSKTAEDDDWYILFNSSDDFTIDPAQENTFYYFKMVSVNTIGVRQDDDDAAYVQYQIGSTRDVRPDCPTEIYINGNTFSMEIDSVGGESAEAQLWDYRVGSAQPGQEDYGNAMSLPLATASQSKVAVNSLRPGTYNFWAATKRDNSTIDGVYCEAPISREVVIETFLSPWVQTLNTTVFYTVGTHYGTVSDVAPGTPTLRLIKNTAYPFAGTYISPEYSSGYAGTNQTYFYASFTVGRYYATDRTWNGVCRSRSPVGNRSWNFCFTTGDIRTWNNATLNAVRPAGVRVSLLASTTPGGPYEEFEGAETRYIATTARFVKVKIYIDDDSLGHYTMVGPIQLYGYRR